MKELNLADRMKRYEKTFHFSTTIRTPTIIRVDGRAFHTVTAGLNKPFDLKFMTAMVQAAKYLANELQGFKVAYIQSDEASFCITDYDNLDSQGWFDYDLAKMISISASIMTVQFNRRFFSSSKFDSYLDDENYPVFDSRAFSVPKEDVANYFLWRAKDWNRNSIQMYARSFFSHKELENKSCGEIHEMLHLIGKNWTNDLSEMEHNGTFLVSVDRSILENNHILPNYLNINDLIKDRI